MTALVSKLMPKQWAFVTDNTSEELLYSGAFGAGKTRALCARAVRLAMRHPGARVGILRKTSADVKRTTLVTLLERDGDLQPVLPPGAYEHRPSLGSIRLHGGGEIIYLGFEDPEKIGSIGLTDALIDEGIELDEKQYAMVVGRCRMSYTLPDGTKNINSKATVTNPGAPTHFLYKRFYLPEKDTGLLHPYRRLIETNVEENYYLPDRVKRQFSEFTGTMRARYYLGQWVAFEGQIYHMFDPDIHVCHKPNDFSFYVAGVDWGFTNPTAIRIHGCRWGDRASHVVSEHYEGQKTSDQVVELAVMMKEHFNPLTMVVDPSAVDLISQLRRADVMTVEANNSVESGIRQVMADLTPTNDGKPWMTMEPTCGQGNAEYPIYRWKQNVTREEPVKELDHALDADRYARMYIAADLGKLRTFIPLDGRAYTRQNNAAETARLAGLGITNIAEDVRDPMDHRLWPDRKW